jgi:hypothetical protein
MSRIRTVKPELFVHDVLFDAEQRYGLPLSCAFIGLFTLCDREGRFRWKPRRLKPLILTHDTVDFSKLLNALAHTGFVKKYLYQGEIYGCIPSWSKHQRINSHEARSFMPCFEDPDCLPLAEKAIEQAMHEPSPAFEAQASLASQGQAVLPQAEAAIQTLAPSEGFCPSPLESLRQALSESPSSSLASGASPKVPTQHHLGSLEALQGVPWILERSEPLYEIVQASYKEEQQWLESSESGMLAPSSFDFLAEDPLFMPKNIEENERYDERATHAAPSKPCLASVKHARACIAGKEGEQEEKGSLRGRGSKGGKPPHPPSARKSLPFLSTGKP